MKAGYSEDVIQDNIVAGMLAGKEGKEATDYAYKIARRYYKKKYPSRPFPLHLLGK